MSSIQFLGYSVYTGDMVLDSFGHRDNKTIVNTINPHSYCEAKKDLEYRQALEQSTFLLPDGIGIVMALFILTGRKFRRFAGYDLHLMLLRRLNCTGGKVFYLGASPQTLKEIQRKAQQEFPNIAIKTYSPPYEQEFSIHTNNQIIDAINTFKPDILYVGMTAPKQEKWVCKHKDRIDAQLIASIGAVFDFYAGTIPRPEKFWLWMNLEWFIRLLREPKRLWRRSIISGPSFFKDIFLARIGFFKYAPEDDTNKEGSA
jgi:N-acetylglucosaminyldiphosphoundecaprenol N-acetyl-beta-D-mannosaminyltransferase